MLIVAPSEWGLIPTTPPRAETVFPDGCSPRPWSEKGRGPPLRGKMALSLPFTDCRHGSCLWSTAHMWEDLLGYIQCVCGQFCDYNIHETNHDSEHSSRHPTSGDRGDVQTPKMCRPVFSEPHSSQIPALSELTACLLNGPWSGRRNCEQGLAFWKTWAFGRTIKNSSWVGIRATVRN